MEGIGVVDDVYDVILGVVSRNDLGESRPGPAFRASRETAHRSMRMRPRNPCGRWRQAAGSFEGHREPVRPSSIARPLPVADGCTRSLAVASIESDLLTCRYCSAPAVSFRKKMPWPAWKAGTLPLRYARVGQSFLQIRTPLRFCGRRRRHGGSSRPSSPEDNKAAMFDRPTP